MNRFSFHTILIRILMNPHPLKLLWLLLLEQILYPILCLLPTTFTRILPDSTVTFIFFLVALLECLLLDEVVDDFVGFFVRGSCTRVFSEDTRLELVVFAAVVLSANRHHHLNI